MLVGRLAQIRQNTRVVNYSRLYLTLLDSQATRFSAGKLQALSLEN